MKSILLVLSILAVCTSARAQEAPYSLPWQLRPAAVATALRLDSAIASFHLPSGDGVTVASMLLGSYRVTPRFAPFLRFGLVNNLPPNGPRATVLTNTAAGVTYAIPLPLGFRLALCLGLTLPTAVGGGNNGKPSQAAAQKAGVLARSAMDNAMFALNDFVLFPGFDLAWVGHGFTVQIEGTLLQLTQIRGEMVQKDAQKTNLTMGLHFGYFILRQLSIGAELRYQRWLTTPAAVAADPSQRDTLTFAMGLRAHVPLPGGRSFHPGIAYARGLDDPMAAANYNIVQIDLPFAL